MLQFTIDDLRLSILFDGYRMVDVECSILDARDSCPVARGSLAESGEAGWSAISALFGPLSCGHFGLW